MKQDILRFIYDQNPNTLQIKQRFGLGEEVVAAIASLIMTGKVGITDDALGQFFVINCKDVPIDFPSPGDCNL